MTLPAIVAGHTTFQDVSAATTRNINTPTHASGDWILIAVCCSANTGNATPVNVSGFNVLYSDVAGTQQTAYLFYKKAGGSEPGNYAITSSSSLVSAIAVAISNFGGIHSEGTITTGSSSTATAPAVTTYVADCLRISLIVADDNPGITSVATLSGHTLLATVTGSGKPTISFQHKDLTGAGTDASQTAALSGSETWGGITFAIASFVENRVTKAGVYLDVLDSQVNITKAGAYLELINNQVRITKAGVYLEFTEPFPTLPVTSRPWFAVVIG